MSNNERLNILLITGTVTREHDFHTINDMLVTLLESTGRFKVKITEQFDGATKKSLESYDAVLINYDGKYYMTDPLAVFEDTTMEALRDFVAEGKGAVFFHSSLIIEKDWPDYYREMAGAYCSFEHGSRKNPKSDATITMANLEHPITKGMAKEWMAVEDDFFASVTEHPESHVQVLAIFDDNVEDYIHVPGFADCYQPQNIDIEKVKNYPNVGKKTPCVWINNYGKGRTFCTTLGHSDGTIKRVNYLTMFVRGVEWAATGEVTLDFPDRSGDKRLWSWPFYKNGRKDL